MNKAEIKTIKIDGKPTYPRTLVEAIKNAKGETLGDLLDECAKKGATVSVATDEEAVAGESNDVVMTPYLVRRFIEENDIGSGSGGGVAVPTITTTLSDCAISYGEALSFSVSCKSNTIGVMKLYVLDNGTIVYTETVKQGTHNIRISNLSKGTHTIQVYAVDRGNISTNTESFTVIVGGLTAIVDFDTALDRQFGSVVSIGITVNTTLVGDVYAVITTNGQTQEVKIKKGYNSVELPVSSLLVGSNIVIVKTVCGSFSTEEESYTFILRASNEIYMALSSVLSEVDAFEVLYSQYQVVANGVSKFHIEWKLVQNSEESLLKEEEVKSGTNTLIWTVPNKIGEATLRALVSSTELYKKYKEGTISESEYKSSTEYKEIDLSSFLIKEAEEKYEEFETGNIICSYEAKGLSNTDVSKEVWSSKEGTDKISIKDASFSSNGWIEGDLVLNGGAYAVNTEKILSSGYSELSMQTRVFIKDTGDVNEVAIDLMGNTGFQVTCDEFIVKTSGHTVTYPIVRDEWIDLGFTMSKKTGLLKLYVNGCIVEPRAISSTESIINTKNLYLGIDSALKETCSCKISYFKMYSRALTDAQVVNNYIAGLPTVIEQKNERNRNNGRDIPEMRVYADPDVFASMTKENKIRVRVVYNGKTMAESFEAPNSIMSWQGTSSIQYAVKNYKIKLRDDNDKKIKYKLTSDSQEESTFCLKADYMESSHMNNTATAKWVNDNLYTEKIPPMSDDPEGTYRVAIDGYPIELYVNDEYAGIYNFNLDKSCTNTFGLNDSVYPDVLSIEVSANSDTSAGAFNVWDMDSIRSDFELRYPDQDDLLGAGGEDLVRQKLTSLQSLIQWVKTSTDEEFVRDIEQHFNKQYLLRYFLHVFIFGMVDNLGKNMFLNTWDGQIWYPSFYDLDSELGLDNTGYLLFDPYIEVTSSVFNTSSSVLWTRVQTLFKTELENEYRDMRNSNYTWKKIITYFENYVKDLSPTHYNNDCTAKYLSHPEYLFMAHGSRMEHFRSWMRSRLIFCDSYFNYDADLSKYITYRANKSGTNTIYLVTNETLYMEVKFRNTEDGSGTVRKLCKKGERTEFTGNINTSTDQEVIIYGAPFLYSFEIDQSNPSKILPGEAINLRKISLTSAKLTDISLVNNSKLRFVYLSGNTLGATAGTESLDLSNCSELEFINVYNTKLQSVQFCPGIKLTYCAIPLSHKGRVSLIDLKCKYFYQKSTIGYLSYVYMSSVVIEKTTSVLCTEMSKNLKESISHSLFGMSSVRSCYIYDCDIDNLVITHSGESVIIKNSVVNKLQILFVAMKDTQNYGYQLVSDIQLPEITNSEIGCLVLSKFEGTKKILYKATSSWNINTNKISKLVFSAVKGYYGSAGSNSNTSLNYPCEECTLSSYDLFGHYGMFLISSNSGNNNSITWEKMEEELYWYMGPSYISHFDIDIVIPMNIKVFINPLMNIGKVGTSVENASESWGFEYSDVDYFIQNVEESNEISLNFKVGCVSRDSNISGYTLYENGLDMTYEDYMISSQMYVTVGNVKGHSKLGAYITSQGGVSYPGFSYVDRGVYLDYSSSDLDLNSEEVKALLAIGKDFSIESKDAAGVVILPLRGDYKLGPGIPGFKVLVYPSSSNAGRLYPRGEYKNYFGKIILDSVSSVYIGSCTDNCNYLVTGVFGDIDNRDTGSKSVFTSIEGNTLSSKTSVSIGENAVISNVSLVTGEININGKDISIEKIVCTGISFNEYTRVSIGKLVDTETVSFSKDINTESDIDISCLEDVDMSEAASFITLRGRFCSSPSIKESVLTKDIYKEIYNKVKDKEGIVPAYMFSLYFLIKKLNKLNRKIYVYDTGGSISSVGSLYLGDEDTSNLIIRIGYASINLFMSNRSRKQLIVSGSGVTIYNSEHNESNQIVMYPEVSFIKYLVLGCKSSSNQKFKASTGGFILVVSGSLIVYPDYWFVSSSTNVIWYGLDGVACVSNVEIAPSFEGTCILWMSGLSAKGTIRDTEKLSEMLSGKNYSFDVVITQNVGTSDTISDFHRYLLENNKNKNITHYISCSSSKKASCESMIDSLNTALTESGVSVNDVIRTYVNSTNIPTDSDYFIDMDTFKDKILSAYTA